MPRPMAVFRLCNAQAETKTRAQSGVGRQWGWEGGGRRTALYTREGGGGGGRGVAARTASVAVEGAVWNSTCSLMVTTAARRASATSPSTDSTMEAQPSAQANSRTSCAGHAHTKSAEGGGGVGARNPQLKASARHGGGEDKGSKAREERPAQIHECQNHRNTDGHKAEQRSTTLGSKHVHNICAYTQEFMRTPAHSTQTHTLHNYSPPRSLARTIPRNSTCSK
jgi:hypothetical protein